MGTETKKPEGTMENIGQRIRNYRRRQNLTQGKLAEYLGVTDQAVSKWERAVTRLRNVGKEQRQLL